MSHPQKKSPSWGRGFSGRDMPHNAERGPDPRNCSRAGGGSYAATRRDLGDPGRALDHVPRLAGGDHAGYPGVALGVLGPALVARQLRRPSGISLALQMARCIARGSGRAGHWSIGPHLMAGRISGCAGCPRHGTVGLERMAGREAGRSTTETSSWSARMSSRSDSGQHSGDYEHFPHLIHPFSFDRPLNDSGAQCRRKRAPERKKPRGEVAGPWEVYRAWTEPAEARPAHLPVGGRRQCDLRGATMRLSTGSWRTAGDRPSTAVSRARSHGISSGSTACSAPASRASHAKFVHSSASSSQTSLNGLIVI